MFLRSFGDQIRMLSDLREKCIGEGFEDALHIVAVIGEPFGHDLDVDFPAFATTKQTLSGLMVSGTEYLRS